MGKQRVYTPRFKGEVVLESYITGNTTTTANRHGLHESVIRMWRQQFKDNIAKIFERGKDKQAKEIDKLEKIIGRLTIEKELLKKAMGLTS